MIRYYTKNDLEHLLCVKGNHYQYHLDPKGHNYLGLHLDWHYQEEYANITMPNYITHLLKRLQHKAPTKLQYLLIESAPINYIKRDNVNW